MRKTLLKVAISLLLIATLLHGADVPSLLARFGGVNPWHLFAAVLVMSCLSFVYPARWATIMRANGGRMRFAMPVKLVRSGRVRRAFFLGPAAGIRLPIESHQHNRISGDR